MKLQIIPPESKEQVWMTLKHLVIPSFLYLILIIILTNVTFLYPRLVEGHEWYIFIPLILGFPAIIIYGHIKLKRFNKKIKTDSKLIRSTGIILILAGLLSIVFLFFSIDSMFLFSTNFILSFLMVVCFMLGIIGISVARGNVTVVRAVRWNIALIVSMITGYIIALPLIGHILLPFGLLKANLILHTWWFVSSATLVFALIVILYWAYFLLNRKESLDAIKDAGFCVRKPWFAYLFGFIAIAALLTFHVWLMTGKGAIKAKTIAEEKFGSAYEYHIYGIMVGGDHGHASLIAYSENEIKTVEVSW